jgi:hypothetical protein
MRIFKIYCSLVFGVGFTALVATTMTVTWIIGIALLMPGIVVNWLASMLHLPQTYAAVLGGDALLYSALAAVPVSLLTGKKQADRSVFRWRAAMMTIVVTTIVVGGWLAARRVEERGSGPCRNEVTNEVKSPDGKSKVVLFSRDCGATTSTALEISILPGNRTINHADVANAFVAEGNHGASSLQYVYADWTSNDTVVITYPAKARVFSQQKRVENISISYVAK